MGVQKNIGLLKAKNEQLTENLKLLILEEQKTRELVIGTLEILKLMPDYDEALKQLEANNLKNLLKMDIKEIKLSIIEAGEKAVKQLVKVAKEDIIKYESEDPLAADRLKNAAATKKLAIFDAFEILKRIEEERALLDGNVIEKKNNTPKGFAESRSK